MRASLISITLMTLVVMASACGSIPTPTAAPPTSTPIPTPTAAPPMSTPIPTPTAAPPTSTPTPTPITAPPTGAPTQVFTLATSIEDIMGTWHNEAKGIYLRFYEDGTVHWSHSLDSLDYQSYAICKVRFEGTQMFLKERAVSSGIPSCGDTPGIYEVRLLPDGKIRIVKVKEECSPRARDTALQYDPVR